MRSVINYFLSMLPYALIAIPFAILWRKGRQRKFKKYSISTTKEHEVVSVLFVMFIFALASQTVIPEFFINTDGVITFNKGYDRINFVLFKEIDRALSQGGSFFIINIIGNILVFAPIAFYIALLYNKANMLKCVLITALCSVFVEICQIPQDRATDIDDVILNTIGGFVGYILYLAVEKLFPKFTQRCKIGKQ